MNAVNLRDPLPASGSTFRRIMVTGSGGAGKSYLARKLASLTGSPLFHLDKIYWLPGWVAPDPYVWRASVQEIAAQPEWIIDGNFGETMDCRIERADAIVFIDMPRIVCLARILLRWFRYRGRVRDDVGAGCREKLDQEFLRWVWNYPNFSRSILLTRFEHSKSTAAFYHLRNANDVRRFLQIVETVHRETKSRSAVS